MTVGPLNLGMQSRSSMSTNISPNDILRTTIKDGCNYCRCIEGLVACSVGSIDKGCLYYENTESTTPPPNGCKFENQYRYDGEVKCAVIFQLDNMIDGFLV